MQDDPRPQNCRFRLMDEKQAYPRSGCNACGATLLTLDREKCSRRYGHEEPTKGEGK